jgi:hypothetical protein
MYLGVLLCLFIYDITANGYYNTQVSEFPDIARKLRRPLNNTYPNIILRSVHYLPDTESARKSCIHSRIFPSSSQGFKTEIKIYVRTRGEVEGSCVLTDRLDVVRLVQDEHPPC